MKRTPPDTGQCLPVLVLLLTSRCDCRCVTCGYWHSTQTESLSLKTIESITAQAANLNVRHFVLSGGEPLEYPEIDSALQIISGNGFSMTLLTNGLSLEEKTSLVAKHCHEVIVSLDGPEPVHDMIRGIPGAFQKLSRGIDKIKKEKIPISARSTVSNLNFESLPDTIRAAKQLGLDSISFLPADVSNEHFNRNTLQSGAIERKLSISKSRIPLLKKVLEDTAKTYKTEFDNQFIKESISKLKHKIYDYYYAMADEKLPVAPRCNAPWTSCVVEPDGAVKPCFFQPALGTLNPEKNLKEILFSRTSEDWRDSLDIPSNPICRRCVCSLYWVE